MARNLFQQFRDLIPQPPLQVGTVTVYAAGVATVQMPGGGLIKARGTAAVDQRVFVRDDVIEGPAPLLTIELIEV